jgi:TPR repeat protein
MRSESRPHPTGGTLASRVHPDFKKAVRLLDHGQAGQALVLAESMIRSEDASERLDGYVCRGFVYEDGGAEVAVDLDRSLDSFRRASLLAPNAFTFLHMARVCLKRRDPAQALRFLEISAEYEILPETLLGFAQWHEESDPMDLSLAKSYYVKAALKGRFAGFFGYSRVARVAGQPCRALWMDVLRIVCGPLIALAIGARAQFKF